MSETKTIRFPVTAVYDRETKKLTQIEYADIPLGAYAKTLIRIFESHARYLGAEPFADLLGLKGAVCPYPMNTYHERLAAQRAEDAQRDAKAVTRAGRKRNH